MMDTFTKARGTRVTTSTRVDISTSLPPEPPLASNENKDPGATPPPSPKKHSSPPTPKSTPLHRRFLREVTMSPATPPRTPNRTQPDSPTKGHGSAKQSRESPSKQKLEVGQNGFYFSCELPMSKITPKKGATPKKTGSPKKDRTTDSRTERKLSPLKNSSTAKKSPARALTGTPTRKTGTPTQSRAATPKKRTDQSNMSPTSSIKNASRFAQGLPLTPITTLRIPPECLKDVAGEVAHATVEAPTVLSSGGRAPPTKKAPKSITSQPLDIGYLMASLKASAQKTSHPVEDDHSKDQDGTQKSEPPTPLRRAAERLPSTEFGTMPKTVQNHTLNVSVGTQTIRPLFDTITKSRTALGKVRQVQAPPYPSSVFPISESGVRKGGLKKERTPSPKKHVKWQDPHSFTSKAPRYGTPTMQKHIGTDPAVFFAMCNEMVKAEASMHHATGDGTFFQAPVNDNELPMMPNSLFQESRQATMPDPVSTPSLSRALSGTSSNTSFIGTVRASMVMSVQKRNGTPNVQSTSQPFSHITTPVSARKENIATAKQTDQLHMEVLSIPNASHTSTRRLATIKSPVVTATAATTPRRRSAIPRIVKTSSRPRGRDPTVRVTLVSTPAKSKIEGASIVRGVRKSIFDTPSPTKVTPAAKPLELPRKQLPRTPFPATTRKPGRPAAPQLYNPTTDLRPYEKKFASAVDIADRIAKWNIEDRKKAAPSAPPDAPRTMKSPNKLPIQPARQTMSKNSSYTPQGSPTKLPSPIENQPLSLSSPEPSAVVPKPPRTPAPRTQPAVTRVKEVHALKTPATPAMHRISVLDRNALRTPSKAIESSLDRAIDGKIAEDAASGKEFTSSGNRIRDLLDAVGKGVGV